MKSIKILKTSAFCGLLLFITSLLSFTTQKTFTSNQLLGKGNPDIAGTSYTSTMHVDAKAAFLEMKSAAAKEGIALEIVSAYRSFERQKEIFEAKYKRFTKQGLSPENAIKKIIEYSTIPGTSRHHWGTDIDIIDSNASTRPKSVLQEQHFYGNGPFCNMKEWLNKNAAKYGFYEAYTNNEKRKGFKYEPWHFSYAPVSIPMLKSYKKLDLKAILLEEKIAGSTYFTKAFIEQYRRENILDINPKLL